jgi:hypothetical protein
MFESQKGEEVELALVNTIRERVKSWRSGEHSGGVAYDGASSIAKELLELWRSEDQVKALTAQPMWAMRGKTRITHGSGTHTYLLGSFILVAVG